MNDDAPENRHSPQAPAAAAATRLPLGLSGIPGLEMSRALIALPGQDALYARVLRRFADHYADGLPGLETSAEAERWTEIARSLHGLLGASAAVGAVDLARHCRVLEGRMLALADGSAGAEAKASVPPALAALQTELRTLAAAIGERLASPSSPAAGLSPPPQ